MKEKERSVDFVHNSHERERSRKRSKKKEVVIKGVRGGYLKGLNFF